MHRAHKIRMYPNKRQVGYFQCACGVSRFAYNWGLEQWEKDYEAYCEAGKPEGGSPSEAKLRKQLNAIKKDEFPWMGEVTKYAPQQALINLGRAFDRFFTGQGKYPRFKKRGAFDSFYVGGDQFKVSEDGWRVWIPKMAQFCGGKAQHGWVRLAERFRYVDDSPKILSATVSRRADRWHVSINCELDVPSIDQKTVTPESRFIGVDMGTRMFTLSHGDVIETPRPLTKALARLRRAQQSLARKKKGSHNYQKQKMTVARLHMRVADIRADWLHKLTTNLVRDYDVISIETLDIQSMVKNKYLSRSVMDVGMGEFTRLLEYKTQDTGAILVKADQSFPSTRTCSRCGMVRTKLSLSTRMFTCKGCGYKADRDVNAAVNLEYYARQVLSCQPAESSLSLCVGNIVANTQTTSMKQEENITSTVRSRNE